MLAIMKARRRPARPSSTKARARMLSRTSIAILALAWTPEVLTLRLSHAFSSPASICGARRVGACARMQQDGARTPQEIAEMAESLESDGKLSFKEKLDKAMKESAVNPAYWNRQFVTASHVSNNVPKGSTVLELGKDAKNLYYLDGAESATLIIPPSNQKITEGPIREAAAKLNLPFSLFTEQALDTIPIQTNSFDAALCFDMLDGAPEQAAQGAVALLSSALKPGGRLLFLERSSVKMAELAREIGGCSGARLTALSSPPDPSPRSPQVPWSLPARPPRTRRRGVRPQPAPHYLFRCAAVEYETEGGFDVGVATRRVVGKSKGARTSRTDVAFASSRLSPP